MTDLLQVFSYQHHLEHSKLELYQFPFQFFSANINPIPTIELEIPKES